MPTQYEADVFRANLVSSVVAMEFGITPMDPCNPARRGPPQMVLARQVAIYLIKTVFCINNSRAAGLFRRDPATAMHACAVVESYRDDPVMDRRLCALEDFLRSAPMVCYEVAA